MHVFATNLRERSVRSLYCDSGQTEQLCWAWWRQKVSFLYAHVCPRSTHIWRTAKLSDKTHKHWIHPHYFFYYPSIEQLSHTNPTPPTLDRITATAANNFQLTFIQPMHLLAIDFGLAHRLLSLYPFLYQPTCTSIGFTCAHNQANRASGVDITSLWGAYPGVLSDTPMHWVC